MAARKWTMEQRESQAKLIALWKPWNQSTGARTPQGKATASKNAHVGKVKRLVALEQAYRDLAEAKRKITKLSEGRRSNHPF